MKSVSSLSFSDLECHLSSSALSPLSSAIKCAWAVLHQTYDTYSEEEVCIGFTGGKDCTVVLHLMLAYLKQRFNYEFPKVTGLYLKGADPFPETEKFIDECQKNFNVKMIVIDSCIKDGLLKLKKTHPFIKSIVMGTRRHDPYSLSLRPFSLTDSDWPQYMRIMPILDWTYGEVWEFLNIFQLPYCTLYDEGYTSIGYTINTHKNPYLQLSNGKYLPAYNLENVTSERVGRKN
ncbi:FAD synthase isoform X1 [Hydra vulgaris]|uniref:FAD synthase isoform X1 n=1 Tax=Hydra vulgaris TaxID=6087 RepID=UPI0001923D36|nr:FAD synthase [Hydra vulgaris]